MRFNRFALFTALIVSACTFSSDEEYFQTIDPPDPSEVSVDLSNYAPGDTIRIFQQTTFQFNVNTNGGRVQSAKVKVGDNEISTSTNSFTYSPSYNQSGTFVLSIEFIATTGTGSLADKLDAEKYSGVTKWVLIADFSRPLQPPVELAIDNGRIKISWLPYTKPNFVKYLVDRIIDGNISKQTEITDPKQTTWYDDDYVGGSRSVKYRVTIQNVIGYGYGEKQYSYPFGVTFSFNEADTTITMRWNKNPFYNVFKEYVIKVLPNVISTITQVDDTTRTFKLENLIFGSSITCAFETNAKTKDIFYNEVQQHFHLAGKPLPIKGTVYYSSHLSSFLIPKGDGGILFLNDDLEVTTEKTYPFSPNLLPFPGKYFYKYDANGITLVDLTTGETYSHNIFNATSRAGTGNGLIAASTYSRNGGLFFYSTYIYDLLNMKKIFSKGSSSPIFDVGANPVDIAEDGNYFVSMSDTKFYKVIPGDTSVLTGVLSNSGRKFVAFRPDKSHEIMYTENGAIIIYDANTLNLLRTINPPKAGFYYQYYDPYSKFTLWTKDTEVYLVHIETGQTRYFKARLGSGIYYRNGYLFNTETGTYMKIL